MLNIVGNNATNYPTADSYKQYDQRTHVYMKPDMYIGTDEKVTREEWLYDFNNKKMFKYNIDFVPGCERLFLEILTNASDSVGKSRRAKITPGNIEIFMNNSTISVTNYGLPIPIEIHPTEKVYVPQMIFGSLLTSSNYEVDRHECGTNGIGAKATNIFSKSFMVIVIDHNRHLKYTQVWNENMRVRSDPLIEQYNSSVSSVQVVYQMDFERFKYLVPNGDQGGYEPVAFNLFARHAIDISFTAKTKVIFNNIEFDYSNIRNYARLYFGDAVDSAVIHYQWPPNTELVNKKGGYQIAKDPSIKPDVELIAIDTPDEGNHVSFVNCMMTKDGGVHVNAAIKSVCDSTVSMINDQTMKKLTRQSKGKEIDAKDKRSYTININDVKPHISILLSVKVVNPKFTSQTKTTLSSPTPKIDIGEDKLRIIGRWKLIERLYAALEAKQFNAATKTDGKNKKYVKLLKGIDANNAGKTDRHKCVLYITEGQSGASYANKMISYTPGTRDFIGVLPMKGKGLNVMKADRFQIEKNIEINELKKMLGLSEGVDYLDQNNFNKLRYGCLLIMADSDVDGKHIIGLIINFFYCRFPSLLARGFVMFYRSPILRVTFNKNVYKFYTQREYNNWKNSTPNYDKWSHDYYKGLGSSKDSEIKDDYNNQRIVTCVYDDQTPAAVKLAFDRDLTDERKKWICNWDNSTNVEEIDMQPISWFINHELIQFSIEDTQRSIPKLTDSFKESQRKIIYAAHLKWNITPGKQNYDKLKVAQFAAYIAEKSNYHHGESILGDVIFGMAQNFITSNNIPWFGREGQVGSYVELGKDAAAPRYVKTKPEKLMGFIIRKEDKPILESIVDEGDKVEPKTYWPIIPMCLVNGAQGIGTGFSTFVPNHNPVDIINWLKLKLNGSVQLPLILPWYRDYTGTIKIIDRRNRKKTKKTKVIFTNVDGIITNIEINNDTNEDDTTDENLNEFDFSNIQEGVRPLLSMVTLGTYHITNNSVVITALPLGRSPNDYHKWLEILVEEKKITGFNDNSADNTVRFELFGFREMVNHRTLKLKRTMGMSNMVFLNENGKPTRYDTSTDILEAFYKLRLPVYQLRKDYILKHLTEEIVELNHKIKFIKCVIENKIIVINRNLSNIYAEMDKLEIPHNIHKKSKTRNFTVEEINKLMNDITDKQNEINSLVNTKIETMWLNELTELESVYYKEFGEKKIEISKLNIVD